MKRTKETGITLIALVITIIVILLLAGVSITMISGNNGILTQSGNASKKTAYAEIYEEMRFEGQSYVIEKNTKTYTDSFKEYLKSKGIINDGGIVDIEKLNRGKTKYGNGTSIESGDVYILEEEISAGEASTNNIKEYKLVYYGKTENVELGIVFSEESLTSALELEYEYLFAVDSNGDVKLNPSYSFYDGSSNLLASKNGYKLTNLSLIIPSSINGQMVTSIPGSKAGDKSTFGFSRDIKKIKIPNKVNTIEGFAFCGGFSLETIQIPVSVTSIGSYAFDMCDCLKNVYYEGTEEQWNSITIEYGNYCLTNANITYNYRGNDIVEYGEETSTKLID